MPARTPQTVQITSTSNPRVKWLAGLQRRRNRSAERVTVVEGAAELALALEAGVRPTTLYSCPALIRDTPGHALVARVAALGCEVVTLGPAAFAKVAYRDGPDGIIAVVPDPTRDLDQLAIGDPANPALVLVCEGVEKPGNLGAMLRTAEAAGVDAVVAASPVTDWGNPNVVRASKGTLFAVPLAAAPSWEVLHWLRGHALSVIVAAPEAPTLVTDVDLTGPVALVVGAEHTGVGTELRDAADHVVRLPMAGRVNSLNVSAAAAVTLYEAVRQRRS